MRPIAVMIFVGMAGIAGPTEASAQALPAVPKLDFNAASSYHSPQKRGDNSDVLLHGLSVPPPSFSRDMAPGVDVGSFHGSLGGVTGGRRHWATYHIDTGNFFNSSVSGSLDRHGASVMLSLPTQ